MLAFHRWMLRATSPGQHWGWSCMRVAILAKLAAMTSTIIASPIASIHNYQARWWDNPSAAFLLFAIVLAPVIETVPIWLSYRLLYRRFGAPVFLCVSVSLAVLQHAPPSWLAFHAAGAFLVLSYQYVSFRSSERPVPAFWAVALAHGVMNGAVILLIVSGVLGQER